VNYAVLVRPVSHLLMLVLMLFFEWFAPFLRSEQKKSYRFAFHFCMSIANTSLLYIILAWPIYTLMEFTQTHKLCFTALLGLSGLSEIVATVIAFDFWDYWMHLANHKISFLWRFHRAHHTDMEVDVTTALRFHIGELIISGAVKCAMIVVWGPSLWGLVIFDSLLTGASEFHHSNVNIPFRVQDLVEAIVVTPRMHRCHHALHHHCFNTNFSTILSIWDRLFRSYHWANLPAELEPIGLFRPRGPSTMQLKPFLLTPIKES
jgi:sterol desaturase/sphingolipid hydroxylase (fatty acid hydroxylase superfamily)